MDETSNNEILDQSRSQDINEPEEVTNFSVTENNSWDAHQPSFGHTEELAKGAFSALQGQPQPGFGTSNTQGGILPPGPSPMPGMTPPPGPVPMPGMTPPPGPVPPQNIMHQGQPGAMMQPPTGGQPEMSVKDWFFTLFLSYIPIAGLIMQIIWAAEKPSRPEYSARKNWAIATLIWKIIRYVLGVVLYFLFIFVILEILDYYM